MLRLIRFTAFAAILLCISACTASNSSLPATNRDRIAPLSLSAATASIVPGRHGTFDLEFDNGKTATIEDVTLSRKGKSGEWLSIKGADFEVQYHSSIVRRIRARSEDGRSLNVGYATLPSSARAATNAAGGNPLASVRQPNFGTCLVSVPGARVPMSCCTMDLCGMDPWGQCGFGSMCGVLYPTDIGVGTVIANPSGEFACEFNLPSGIVDCYDEYANPTNDVPIDLTISISQNFVETILTCSNPPSNGWGEATYSDPKQRGGAIHRLIPRAPGQHVWNFPVDFSTVIIGMIYPPSRPTTMASVYFKYGNTSQLRTITQGYCKGRLN